MTTETMRRGPRPPYGEIADLLKAGQVVPFLGAGASWGARLVEESDGVPGAVLPTGDQLSRFLAEKASFPFEDKHELTDLARVASYFAETTGRRRLRARLREIFDRAYAPSDIHTFLAGLNHPLLIFTTNYDDLTEQAFTRAGREYDLVVHPTDRDDVGASVLWWEHGAEEPVPIPPNELRIDLCARSVIYKMHGSVDRMLHRWDSYVITEEDYVDFLSRMTGQTAVPASFMWHCRTRSFLFLGYGLRDWNLRVVLNNLRMVLPTAQAASDPGGHGPDDEEDDELDEIRSWAIQHQPSDLEVALWNARNVKIYDVSMDEFVRELGEQMG